MSVRRDVGATFVTMILPALVVIYLWTYLSFRWLPTLPRNFFG
jgi:hypothetical protein